MPYFIETTDRAGTAATRAELRPAHLDYLRAQAALLLACGAKLDDEGENADGSVYIVDVETRDEAQAFIDADPFTRGDLFESVRIRRWRKAVLAGVAYV